MAGINLPIIAKFDDKGIKQATYAFDGIGKTLGKLGGVIAAAFSVRAIVNFAQESVAAAEGVAVANARIDQIAKSMGIFGEQTQAVADRLKSYAEANELTLATDAEVIKATQAKLLTFRELANTADEAGGSFDRATAAAVDLAAAGFGTAETNAVQLGKALQDPVKGITALRRAGITFTEAEKEKIATLVESGQILEAQNLVLAAIETQVGGTAAATATASEKMALAFDNLKETAGAALMPAFAAVAEALVPIAEEIAPVLGEAIEDLIPAFEELAGFIPELVGALVPLIPALTKIIGAIVDLAIELMPVIDELLPLFVLLIDEALVPLIPILVDLIAAFLPLIEEVLPILTDLLRTIVIPILMTVADVMSKALITAIDFLTGALRNLTNFFRDFGTNISNIWTNATKAITDALSNMGRFFSDAFTNIRNTITKSVSDFGNLLFKAGQDLVQGLINGVLNFGAKIANILSDVVSGAVDGVKNLLGINSPSKVFKDIGENIGDGLIRGIDSKITAVAASAKALAKASVPAGFEWVIGPNGPYLERTDVVRGNADAPTTPQGEAVQATMFQRANLQSQGFSSTQIDQIFRKAVGGTAEEIANTFTPGVELINKTLNRRIMGNLGEAEVAKLQAQGFTLVGKVAAATEDVSKALSDLTETILSGGAGSYLMGKGGFVSGPTRAIIGEAGPEVVMPLDRFESAMGMNSKPSSYNININAGIGSDPVSIGREVVNAIKRYESVSGKVFVSA